ncbi:hypothetical protein GGR52DRAFT_568500 [Hypoxylon sp. FL1284]|nr:hypothetical protein GGR52DRAFT_577404 [Hypoxylon sp. FL1284]KAI0179732.1 hypothetical protein GGR52DRAFT_568500 [Hypoxylon sp. FL1284]
MPNATSSTGNIPSGCQSGPHASPSTSAEQERMRAERLTSGTTGSGNNDFLGRLITGSTSEYDHRAAMSTALSTFTSQFNGTSGGSNGTNNN